MKSDQIVVELDRLMYEIDNGNFDRIEQFVSSSFDLDDTSWMLESPIVKTILEDNPDQLPELKEKQREFYQEQINELSSFFFNFGNGNPPDEETILFKVSWAIRTGRIDFLELYFAKGGDPNLTVKADFEDYFESESLIHHAIEANSLDVLKLFVKYGANLNLQTELNKDAPIHIAVAQSNSDIVEFLLDNGADVNIQRQNGEMPLHISVKTGNLEMTKLLIDHGGSINAKDKTDVSLLNVAQAFEEREIEKLLIDCGAINNSTNPYHMVVYIPDGYGVEQFSAFAYSEKDTNDGIKHIFVYGVGYTNRWNSLSGFRRAYIRMKNGELMDCFAGHDYDWYDYRFFKNDEEVSNFKLKDGIDILKKELPDIHEKLKKQNKGLLGTILQFKPNSIGIDDFEERFTQLSEFFYQYVCIEQTEVQPKDEPLVFYYPNFHFTKKSMDFTGYAACSTSANVRDDMHSILIRVLNRYMRF